MRFLNVAAVASTPRVSADASRLQHALTLSLKQHPQDESADLALDLKLAPSYVTYHAAAVQRVLNFFKSEQV